MMNKDFKRQLKEIALPVTIQCLMQSSLSLIDQIMIGSLGSESIAGIGLPGKFTSLYSVTLAAVVTVAGILIAQYRGAKDDKGVSDSFFLSVLFCAHSDGSFFRAFGLRAKSNNGNLFKRCKHNRKSRCLPKMAQC